jgi:hypothetical protein
MGVVRTLHLPEDLKLCGDDCAGRFLYSHVVAVRGYVNIRPRRDDVRPRRLYEYSSVSRRRETSPAISGLWCCNTPLHDVTKLPL